MVHARAVKPHACMAEAEAATVEWAARWGLVRNEVEAARLGGIRCGSCAAHTYANQPADVVKMGAQLIAWLFLFDDAYGESGDLDAMPAVFESFEALLFGRGLPAEPSAFHLSLADLRDRLIARANDVTWPQRFAYSLRRYFDGCLLEYPYRRTQRSPSLSVYRSVRRWSIGVQPVLDLVELGLPYRLTPEMSAKRQMWELRDRAAMLCAWANDLYSFEKERDAGDPLNLVSVLRAERRLPIDRTFADAVGIYNDDLAAFEQVMQEFLADPRTCGLERSYLDGVCDWIHGNHVWTRECRRYR
jgi:5-epi-alpha-selinene synthase